MNIGIIVIATNKYTQFILPLYESIKKYFYPKENTNIFCFTDKDKEIVYKKNLITISIKHEPWPMMTLKRYEIFHNNRYVMNQQDYLFYMDIDMLIINYIDDILGEVIGTCHPYQNEKVPNCTYERNSKSLAYIPIGQGKNYFAGGFQGGKTDKYLAICEKLSYNINRDLENNIIALWNDESHWNRYLLDNPPDRILSPDYCCPEGKQKYTTKIIALNKNHNEIRS